MAKLQIVQSNHYKSLSKNRRAERALEMAEEILAHHQRMIVLAAAAQNYVAPIRGGVPEPSPKGEDAEIVLDSAKHFLALLASELEDIGQNYRLIECLRAM